MSKALKGLYIGAAAAFIVFSQANAGYEEMQVKNLDKRVTELEHKKGNGGMINPSVNPVVKDGVNMFISADFIWMSAREDGLVYAQQITTGEISDTAIDVNCLDTNKNWKPGFKVGIGYYMNHDDWDIQLNWLRMHGNREDSNTSMADVVAPVDYLAPVYGMFAPSVDACAKASCTWKSDIDLVDLEIGRDFYVSKHLALRPFLAARCAVVNQKLDNTYEGLFDEGELTTSNEQVNMKDNYTSFGPRIGLNGEWMFTDNFSLFGNAAIAGLYGKVKVHERDYEYTSTSDEPVEGTVRHAKDDYFAGKAISDLALGLRWATKFKDDRYGLAINLAWEHHMFFNFNNFPIWETEGALNYRDVKSHGDLSLQGLSIGLKFDF